MTLLNITDMPLEQFNDWLRAYCQWWDIYIA